MKTSLSIVLLAGLVGCSDDADIGIDTQPVTCLPDSVARVDVSGSIKDPQTQTQYAFEVASASASGGATAGTSLSLQGEELMLHFAFYCGAAERAKYGVKGDTQQGLECPLEVASAVYGGRPNTGGLSYLPAQSGTMIVDENANCLAGRFRVDFGSAGEITGSFTTPWQ